MPLLNKINRFLDPLGRRRNRRDLNARRILQKRIRQSPNLRRHCRREQQRLALRRQPRNNLSNVVNKTHVQHAIRFVENYRLNAA